MKRGRGVAVLGGDMTAVECGLITRWCMNRWCTVSEEVKYWGTHGHAKVFWGVTIARSCWNCIRTMGAVVVVGVVVVGVGVVGVVVVVVGVVAAAAAAAAAAAVKNPKQEMNKTLQCKRLLHDYTVINLFFKIHKSKI